MLTEEPFSRQTTARRNPRSPAGLPATGLPAIGDIRYPMVKPSIPSAHGLGRTQEAFPSAVVSSSPMPPGAAEPDGGLPPEPNHRDCCQGTSAHVLIRLLVVDDHEMMREGLRWALDGTGMEIFEAANGHSALDILGQQRINIVLLDIDLPGLDGLEVLSRIKQLQPDLPVLMHSCHDRLAFLHQSLELGAAGYLVKSPDATHVGEAVRTAMAGGSVWTADQLRRMARRRSP